MLGGYKMKALITGASSGIGRDMARVLASKKYDLVLVARNLEKLNNLAEELSKKYEVKIQTITQKCKRCGYLNQ